MNGFCTYPQCDCPFDSPGDNWCARGFITKKEQKMDNAQPVKLPLQIEISRCLGHNGRLESGCEKRDSCARHVTISHPNEPWDITKPPYYRICSRGDYTCFMEIAK